MSSLHVFRRAATLNMRRTPLRSTQLTASLRGVRFNTTGSAPPTGKSNTPLFAALGLAVIGGGGYWFYTSQSDGARGAKTSLKEGAQVAKSLANYTPKKEDYQEVYNKIADVLDTDDYDGELLNRNRAIP